MRTTMSLALVLVLVGPALAAVVPSGPDEASSGRAVGPPGWFIDDVVVIADTLHKVLQENFESGILGWTHGGTNDSWGAGEPSNPAGPAAAHSGTRCVATGLGGPCPAVADCWLQSPDFNLSLAFSAHAVFYDWFVLGDSDYVVVSVEALWGGETRESDGIRFNGSQPSWTEKAFDFGKLTIGGKPFPCVGSEKVSLKFRLVTAASSWLSAAAGDGLVRLEWTPASPDAGLQGYTVYRGDAPSALSVLRKLGVQTYYCDTDVANGRTYYYTVAPFDAGGEGARFNIVNATPGHRPGPPVNVTVTAGNLLLRLCWEPPGDIGGLAITEYRLYRGEGLEGELHYLASPGNTTGYVDRSVANGTVYRYAVSAANAYGEGEQSDAAFGSPGREPSPPRDLRGSGNGTTIHLSWSPPADADVRHVTGYTVHRSNGTGPWLRFEQEAVTEMDDTLERSESQILYNVTAFNEFGGSEPSATVQLTAPMVPELVEAFFGPGRAYIRWSPPFYDGGCAIRHYVVYRSFNSVDFEAIGRTPDNRTTFNDPEATSVIYAVYGVAAVNAVGEGTRSPAASMSIDASTPTVYFERPRDRDVLNSTSVECSGGAKDPVGVDQVELSWQPDIWILCDGTERWNASLELPEGTTLITARVTDFGGNRNTTDISVTVDLSAPLVRFDYPMDGHVVTSETINVSVNVTDATAISGVQVGTIAQSWPAVRGAGCWTAAVKLFPGPNALLARATDQAGNVNITGIVVLYDAHAPWLNMSSPRMWEHFKKGSPIPVAGVATDDTGIRAVEVRVDAGNWTSVVGTAFWSANLTARPGRHTIEARATDLAGRQTTAEVIVTVEKPVEPYANTERWVDPVVLAAVAAVAVTVVAALIWVGGRPKQR